MDAKDVKPGWYAVKVNEGGVNWVTVETNGGGETGLRSDALRPIPSCMTPEERAVIDQAISYSQYDYADRCNYADSRMMHATAVLLASRKRSPPPDPVVELKEAWEAVKLGGLSDVDDWSRRSRLETAIAAVEAPRKDKP